MRHNPDIGLRQGFDDLAKAVSTGPNSRDGVDLLADLSARRALSLTPECFRSRQARCGRRSCPTIEMVGAALKAFREMQYLLSGTGELTRSRSLTQHTGDLSIMLGTGHSRRPLS